MRKILYLPFIAIILISSCGKKESKETENNDSISVNVSEEIEENKFEEQFYLDTTGIASIKIDMPVQSLPDSVEGLYNKITKISIPDAVTYEFSDDEGLRFIGYDFGDSRIDLISLDTPDIKVKTSDGEIALGDNFSSVFSLPGLETEWIDYDDGGVWFWRWQGLWFAPTQHKLTQSLSQKLYNSDKAPVASDFNDEVKIGYIGTGIPF